MLNKNLTQLNPYLNKYFDNIQLHMKNIINNPPYNVDEENTENFVNKFFLNNERDINSIHNIINSCYLKDVDEKQCALLLLKKLYRKFYNNYHQELNLTYINNEKLITKFDTFILESNIPIVTANKVANDGSNGFLILMSILAEINVKFITNKEKQYLNTGKYNLCYFTNHIFDYDCLLNDLELKQSLVNTFNSFKSISNVNNLSIFFTLENNAIAYGFYNKELNYFYPTGKFIADRKFIKKLGSYPAFSNIAQTLETININNLILLKKIKKDFDSFINTNESSFIINDNVIQKTYKLTEFKNPQTTHEQFLSYFYNWIYKQSWNVKVDHYIDIDHEKIRFLIKIK